LRRRDAGARRRSRRPEALPSRRLLAAAHGLVGRRLQGRFPLVLRLPRLAGPPAGVGRIDASGLVLAGRMPARPALRGAGRRTAGAVLGGRAEAAAVAQEVAIEMLRGLGRLRDPASFDAWVHRITVRAALRALRGGRERAGAEIPLASFVEEDVPAAGADPADRVGGLAAAEAVRGALGALPPRQRLAVALRYAHDLP